VKPFKKYENQFQEKKIKNEKLVSSELQLNPNADVPIYQFIYALCDYFQ